MTKLHAPNNLVINWIKEKLIGKQGVIKDFRTFLRNLNTKMSKAMVHGKQSSWFLKKKSSDM